MADDLQDVQGALLRAQTGMDRAAQDFLRQASQIIGARATRNYMRNAGKGAGPRARVDVGPLRIVSGRLARSLRGFGGATRNPEGIEQIEQVGAGRFRLTKGSEVPYAAIHEFGGVITITDRMRSFFWAKWYETNDRMWKAMALTTKGSLRIQARPYLRPAASDVTPRLEEMAGEIFTVHIQAALDE